MATREIVGWSMADHLRAALCIGALVMAIQRHRPSRGLVHHGDRGVQYASEPYRAVLERHGITQSMSRRGNCLDNAPMESFFASLKTEHVHQVRFRTREEAHCCMDPAGISRIRHLWTLTDSVVSSLFSGLAYTCNKVAHCKNYE